MPLRAQPLSSPKTPGVQTGIQTASPAPANGAVVWHGTFGTQHSQLLRSRNAAVRARAMQNLIVIAARHPGAFDLKPAVPALLDIYANASRQSHRIMAVAALNALGDRYGIERLDRLSARKHRASKEYRLGRAAVNHYYVTQMVEHETERAAYYTAKGDAKRAERHLRKATFYRSQIAK